MRNLIIGALLLAASTAANAADKVADTCAPDGELKFICGVPSPEDVVALPGEKWIVFSGMKDPGGLHLVNAAKKTEEPWIPASMGAPTAPYDACPSPPVMTEFRAHGLSLRDRGQGRATLFVVNHGGSIPPDFVSNRGGRETIEVFDVDATGKKPSLSWIGCVVMPPGLVANSVTSTPEGELLVTVFMHPGMRYDDYFSNKPTGAVYKWRPGEETFRRVWGTELTGNNGIEASADGKTIYVAGSGAINVYANTNPAQLIRRVPVTEGHWDNLRWAGSNLIIAGAKLSEDKECADRVKGMSGALPDKCIPGYYVGAMDPATMTLTTLATGPGRKAYTGVASALPLGKTLWLGAARGDRIAYRTLP